MRKSSLAILVYTMSVSASSVASGISGGVRSETRNLPAFSSVILSGISTVRIHQGPQAVRITIDEDLIDRYSTEVMGDKLYIGFKCGFGTRLSLKRIKTCEVDISVPALKGITVNGAGKVLVDEFLFEDLRLELTGAAYLEVHGSASALMVSCTGAGKLNARDLASRLGRFSLTGDCDVEARVEEEIEASITGSGELLYWGRPTVSQKISGMGSLRRAGD